MVHLLGFQSSRPARPLLGCLLFLALGSWAASTFAQAPTLYYWSGDGSNNNFGTSGNFKSTVSGGANLVPLSDDKTILVFGARAAVRTTANNSVAGFSLNSMQFENATDSAGTSFTISGSQLEFKKRGSINPVITTSSAQNHTISAPIKLAEPLTLGGNGTGTITLSGAWEGGTKGLIKAGTSNYVITQDASSVGTTTINGGTLALSSTGSLGQVVLNGGVLAQSGTFSRALGTSSTQVSFGSNGGGFAAYGGDLTVSTNLGTWGSTSNSLATGAPLLLGSSIATHTVTLSQNLNLGGAVRTITLADNANSTNDRAVISGTISNGGLNVTGSGNLGLSGGNSYAGATTIGSGASVRVENATALGTTAAGTTVESGGALEVTGGLTVGAEALNISGSGISNQGALRNISGNNSYGGAVTLGASARINSDADTLSLTNAAAVSGGGFTLSVGGAGNVAINNGVATGTGGLTKDGAGTLTLGGTSTYTGATSVTGGTLLVNGTTASGSSVSVGDGSGTDTLGGTGTIGGATAIGNGGRLTAGTAGGVGTLRVNNNLSLSSGSTWLVDLAGASADQILGIINLNLSGATLAFQTQSPSWTYGQSWDIARFSGTRTGTFAGLANGSTFFASGSGGQFQINYDDELGAVTVTAVPEPPTLIALCTLLVGFYFGPRGYRAYRQRRGKRAGLPLEAVKA